MACMTLCTVQDLRTVQLCESSMRFWWEKLQSRNPSLSLTFLSIDVLGLTLKLYLTLTVTIDTSSSQETPVLSATGEGAESAPLNPYRNLITRVALYVLRCHSIPHFPPGLSIQCHNEIPFGRGLGSSGAAVVAGVLLGDQLGQLNLDHSRQLDFALMVERHPDNVAAALLGGFVGSYLKDLSPEDTSASQIPLSEILPEIPEGAEREDWGLNPPVPPKGIGHWLQFGWAKEVKAVVCIPDFEVPTAKAREVMPKSYNIKDVVSACSLNTTPAESSVSRCSISNA